MFVMYDVTQRRADPPDVRHKSRIATFSHDVVGGQIHSYKQMNELRLTHETYNIDI